MLQMRLTTRSSIPKPVGIGIKSTFGEIEENDTLQKEIPTKALGQEVYLPTIELYYEYSLKILNMTLICKKYLLPTLLLFD